MDKGFGPPISLFFMSNLVKAYAVQSPKGLLEPFTYEAAALAPHEVRVKVKYCGICHSDMSMINNEWGLSQYPLVPGHEVIGTVSEVGSDVTSHQVGEVVGIGWQSGSCAHCDYCNRACRTFFGRRTGPDSWLPARTTLRSPCGKQVRCRPNRRRTRQNAN